MVTDDEREVVKFGVTGGDPRPRLSDHRRDGLGIVIRLIENLPDGIALEIENSIRLALRDAKETPTRGREYFPGRCTGLILYTIDNHPAICEARTGRGDQSSSQ
ncbi:hypothetical protein ACE1OC_43105 (plasmid) [Streptomyces sp. DSM 116496]|uniref:hypothetical protein n=1 Tax=Streptomyces stoeckheimensis TaxID=3344656 RepID=UPI0038B2F72A